jgi:class 3 adenylate cyclase/predicted ATPase
MSDLGTWLDGLGLGKYAHILAENEVDFEILPALSEQDLEKIGIPLGARKKLLNALAAKQSGHPLAPVGGSRPSVATATEPPEAPMPAESPSLTGGERRQLTVLFCDMVGFTELASRVDPEVLERVIRRYEDTCAAAITRYDGYVFQRLGDGIVAFFGYPLAHEGEAERAVHAGLEIIKALAKLEFPEVGHLQVRIGIATGLVVISSAAKGAVGEAMNLAARLQGIAQPGSIVVSERVHRLCGGNFNYEDLSKQTLKGIPLPTQAFRVQGVNEAVSRFEAATLEGLTPLIGREQEIGLLMERWELAQEGEGQAVVLSGEPGIGKSRILSVLRERLEAQGARTIEFQCSPFYINTPFYPSIHNFERSFKFEPDESPTSKLDKLEALMVGRYGRPVKDVRFVASLLSIPCEDRYGSLSMTPQRQKEETIRTLVDLTEAVARKQPTLLLFEDAHWADPTTLEVLDLLLARLNTISLLVVLSHRPGFTSRWFEHGHVTALNLSKLTRAQSSAVISKLAGNKSLPSNLVKEILDKTDGVPLFVEELTKSILESGKLEQAGDHYEYADLVDRIAIPATLRDALMGRLDRYQPVREIAQIAAAIGREFSYELILAIAPRSRAELDEALSQLTDSGLAFRRGNIPNAVFTFKHALVRETAYDSLLKSRRQELHHKIARVIEERFPSIKDAEPELLAHHYTEGNMIREAVSYWIKAGQRAEDRSAYKEALGHLASGLRLLPSLPAEIERNRQELRLQTLRAAALQATQGFADQETGQAYARARELCTELGDAPEVFPVLHGVYLFHMLRGEVQAGYNVAVECFQRAKRQDHATPLMFGHRMLGSALLHLGQVAGAVEHLKEMRKLVDSTSNDSSSYVYGVHPRTAAPAFMSMAIFACGYPMQAKAAVLDALSHAEQLGYLYNLGYALHWANMTSIQLRDLDMVRDRARWLQSLGRDEGFPHWAAFGTFQEGVALAGLGDPETGAARMREGLNELRALSSVLYVPFVEGQLAMALASTGAPDEAMATISDALARTERTQELWYEAELYRLKGELFRQNSPEAAEASYRRALDVARKQSAKAWELRAATSLARLLRDQGSGKQAHELLAPLYVWFTEGLETPDLQDAKRLLDDLAAA